MYRFLIFFIYFYSLLFVLNCNFLTDGNSLVNSKGIILDDESETQSSIYPYVACLSQNSFTCTEKNTINPNLRDDFNYKCKGTFYTKSCLDLTYVQSCKLPNGISVFTKSEQSCKNYNSLSADGTIKFNTLTIDTNTVINYPIASINLDLIKWFKVSLEKDIPYQFILEATNLNTGFAIHIYTNDNLNDSIKDITDINFFDSNINLYSVFTPSSTGTYYVVIEKVKDNRDISKDSSVSINLKIQPPKDITLSTTSPSVTIASNRFVWYKINLTSSLYKVVLSNSSVIYNIFNETLEQITKSDNKFWSSSKNASNSIHYIKLENKTNTDISVNLRIEDTMNQATLGNSYSALLSTTNQEIWYKFNNLNTSSFYTFTSSNKNFKYTFLDQNLDSIFNFSNLFKVKTAGVYYIKVQNYSYTGNSAFTLGEPTSLTLSSLFSDSLESSQEKWFKITLSKNTTYQLKMSDINLLNGLYDTYQSSTSYTISNNIATFKVPKVEDASDLSTTEIYYLSIHNNGSTSTNYNVTVCQNNCP